MFAKSLTFLVRKYYASKISFQREMKIITGKLDLVVEESSWQSLDVTDEVA